MPANNLNQQLYGLSNYRDEKALLPALIPSYNYLSSKTLATAGIVISGAGGTTAKVGTNPYRALAGSVYVGLAGGTVLPVLVGTVANAAYNVFVFSIDQNGTTYTSIGTPAATLGGIQFPPIPDKRAILGFVEIHPTGTGAFVGGTTALDDATVVPNAVFVSVGGHFDQRATF